MAGGWPYNQEVDPRDGEAWEADDDRREAEERPRRRRAVSRVIPPGEGSPQVEFYRRVTGAPEVREIAIEEEE